MIIMLLQWRNQIQDSASIMSDHLYHLPAQDNSIDYRDKLFIKLI